MKAIAYLLVGLVSLFCFMVSSSLKAEASDYVGDFCWISETSIRPSLVLKLGVTDMGGGSFIVQSKSTQLDGHVVSAFGNAQIIGNQVLVSLHSTHSDNGSNPVDSADTSSCQYYIDLATLNGTGWCTDTFYNPPTKNGGIDYHKETLTYTVCP